MGAKIMATIEDKSSSANAKVQLYFLVFTIENLRQMCQMQIYPVVFKFLSLANLVCPSLLWFLLNNSSLVESKSVRS